MAAVGNIQGSTTVAEALSAVEASATQLETDLGVSTNKDVQLATAILDLAIGTYEAIVQAHTQVAATDAITLWLPTTAGGYGEENPTGREVRRRLQAQVQCPRQERRAP